MKDKLYQALLFYDNEFDDNEIRYTYWHCLAPENFWSDNFSRPVGHHPVKFDDRRPMSPIWLEKNSV